MQTKLTLRLDKRLIGTAKTRAEHRGKSLSQVVADFFRLLDPKTPSGFTTLPPVTRSLRGLLRRKSVSEQDFRKHLENKYQ